jgi:hypothetical protein
LRQFLLQCTQSSKVPLGECRYAANPMNNMRFSCAI